MGTWSSLTFKLGLTQYIKIIDPLARSLWSLEASKTNPGNVFLFWLAMGVELKSLFAQGKDATGISEALAQKVIGIFNRRYRAIIDETPGDPYFTTFYLNPRKLSIYDEDKLLTCSARLHWVQCVQTSWYHSEARNQSSRSFNSGWQQ